MTRDGMEQRLACMQMALLLRADGRFFLARRRDHNGNDLGEYLDGYGPEQQQRAVEMAREYRNFKLIDMAKEALELRGINPRGMDVTRIAELALQGSSRGRGVLRRAAPNRPRTSRRSWPTSPTRPCARAMKPIRAPSSPSAGR